MSLPFSFLLFLSFELLFELMLEEISLPIVDVKTISYLQVIFLFIFNFSFNKNRFSLCELFHILLLFIRAHIKERENLYEKEKLNRILSFFFSLLNFHFFYIFYVKWKFNCKEKRKIRSWQNNFLYFSFYNFGQIDFL